MKWVLASSSAIILKVGLQVPSSTLIWRCPEADKSIHSHRGSRGIRDRFLKPVSVLLMLKELGSS